MNAYCFNGVYLLIIQGDVYPVEPYDGFAVPQVLDAHWGVLNDDVSNLLNVLSLSLSFFFSFWGFDLYDILLGVVDRLGI